MLPPKSYQTLKTESKVFGAWPRFPFRTKLSSSPPGPWPAESARQAVSPQDLPWRERSCFASVIRSPHFNDSSMQEVAKLTLSRPQPSLLLRTIWAGQSSFRALRMTSRDFCSNCFQFNFSLCPTLLPLLPYGCYSSEYLQKTTWMQFSSSGSVS